MVEIEDAAHEPEWQVVQQPGEQKPSACRQPRICNFAQYASVFQTFNSNKTI